jgi:hypothetical protein
VLETISQDSLAGKSGLDNHRPRRNSRRFIIQIGFAILFGIVMGFVTRHWNTVRSWGTTLQGALASQQDKVDRYFQQEKPKEVPKELPRSFRLEQSGSTYLSLKEAISEAADGDTVLIDGGDLQIVGGVDLKGKALTLKANASSRPILHFIPLKEPRIRQSLLTHDRPLIIEGVDLVMPSTAKLALPSQPLHLIYSQATSLHLTNCRMAASEGHSLIVCRNCPEVKLVDCDILAGASALCLDVGESGSVAVDFTRCRIVTKEPDGAALAFWARETTNPSRVRLNLERNHLEAGRIVSFSEFLAPVEVHASRNEIHFSQAVVSYNSPLNSKAWEKTSWGGGDNTYQGASDWIWVNGNPAGICGLAAWRSCWGQDEPGSSE